MKKLTLKKTTLSRLNNEGLSQIRGGGLAPYSNECDPGSTKDCSAMLTCTCLPTQYCETNWCDDYTVVCQ